MEKTDETKNLKPLKAIIHGPPASGKTKLATKLCQHYGAHYISVKTMIEETINELRENIDRETERLRRVRARKARKEKMAGEEGEVEADEDDDIAEDEEGEGDIEDWQEQIKDISTIMAKSENGRLPDQYVVRLMKSFLAKDLCQTRGFVLDGYPKTMQQAKELFGQASETGMQMEGGGKGGIVIPGEDGLAEDQQVGVFFGNASEKIMPDYVVSLEATDDFLCERVMKLPQREIQGTHYDEVNMLRRLAEFRANNTENNTILTFFDNAGVHPLLIDLVDEETGKEYDLDFIFNFVIDIFGEPIPGFGLSAEEEEAIRRLENEQRRLQEEGDRIERKLMEEKATREYQDKMETWADTFEKLQMEEEKILAAQSEPLRFYLMKYIFPTLSKGLIEVAKVKPDDPIDFLAEFLFKQNPEGKMFDPSYTRDGQKILERYEKDVEPSINRSRTS